MADEPSTDDRIDALLRGVQQMAAEHKARLPNEQMRLHQIEKRLTEIEYQVLLLHRLDRLEQRIAAFERKLQEKGL